jgi:hypothetical protein
MKQKFQNLGILISRNAQKKILGGDEELAGYCLKNAGCTLFVPNGANGGTTYSGVCNTDWGGGSGGYVTCGCETQYGPYVPQGGTTHCYQ